ncbi:MAG: hypothetical protein IH936_14040 [Acidobacteria bacterium]|nr:hypothetical protein [Acidobacteriota bacterium]
MKRNQRNGIRVLTVVVAVGWLLAQAAIADRPAIGDRPDPATSSRPAKPATAAFEQTGITFSIQVDSEFLLTVTGPGFGHRSQGRGTILFQAQDEDGYALPDGIYTYELREIVTSPEIEAWEAEPDRERRDAMRRRLVREGRWPARPRIQSDVFRIEAGRVVAPEAREHHEAEEPSPAEEYDHPHAP